MERACFKLFVRPKGVARLAGQSFTTAEMIAALGISEPVWDSWTRGREALALVAPKGRGKAGRAFPVIDAWALAVSMARSST